MEQLRYRWQSYQLGIAVFLTSSTSVHGTTLIPCPAMARKRRYSCTATAARSADHCNFLHSLVCTRVRSSWMIQRSIRTKGSDLERAPHPCAAFRVADSGGQQVDRRGARTIRVTGA